MPWQTRIREAVSSGCRRLVSRGNPPSTLWQPRRHAEAHHSGGIATLMIVSSDQTNDETSRLRRGGCGRSTAAE